MTMRTFLFIIALLLAGAGCGPGGAPVVTRDLLPSSFVIMDGLSPRNEEAWTLVGEGAIAKVHTTWQTDARFDEVVAFYDAKFKAGGLAVHRIENDQGVRLHWGLAEKVRFMNAASHEYVFVHKARIDGKTAVDIVLTRKPE